MRYVFTLSALAGIILLVGFGSFVMAEMTDHSGDCPVAIANGFNCLNAVSITSHLTAIQQLLQAVVQNVSTVALVAVALLLIFAIFLPPAMVPAVDPDVLRTRASAVSIARYSLNAWQSRCAHSPTFA